MAMAELARVTGVPPETDFEVLMAHAYAAGSDLADRELLDDHRQWLDRLKEKKHLHNWEQQLKDDRKGAVCEMLVKRLLEENGNEVAPNADTAAKRKAPDFRCNPSKDTFFVEVTCIRDDRATNSSGLTPRPLQAESSDQRIHARYFSDMTQTIFEKVAEKSAQCCDLEHPALVAICTLHFQASALPFGERFVTRLLTGTEYITKRPAERSSDAQEPFLSTKLEHALFMLQDALTFEVTPIHQSVSGVLLCGFGCEPARITGLLHPKPVHRFAPHLLKGVPFFQLAAGYEKGPLRIASVQLART